MYIYIPDNVQIDATALIETQNDAEFEKPYNAASAPEDTSQAYEWYYRYALRGVSEAQTAVGKCYYHGTGVEANGEEAVKWFRKAADSNDGEAMLYMGKCYENGIGVAQDDGETVSWYTRAAETGNISAKRWIDQMKSSDADELEDSNFENVQ